MIPALSAQTRAAITRERPEIQLFTPPQRNQFRAESAAIAYTAYLAAIYDEGDPDAQNVPHVLAELLSDLRHLAEAVGVDFDVAEADAAQTHAEEVEEEQRYAECHHKRRCLTCNYDVDDSRRWFKPCATCQ